MDAITSEKVCFRFGFSNFTLHHGSQSRAGKKECGNIGIVGHFAWCSGKFRSPTQGAAQHKGEQNAARRFDQIDDGDSSHVSYDQATGSIFLRMGGTGEAPFIVKGKKDRSNFTAVIDSGSPVTIFKKRKTWNNFWVQTYCLHNLSRLPRTKWILINDHWMSLVVFMST